MVLDRPQWVYAFVSVGRAAGLTLAVQTLAIPLERDNAGAFSDNISGLLMPAPFFIFMVQFIVNGRVASYAVR